MSADDRVVIKDIIKDMVTAAAVKLDPILTDPDGPFADRGFTGLQFIYGKRLAIISELTQKTNASQVKYPLVALFLPIDEFKNAPGYYARGSLNLAIVVDTTEQYLTEDRYDINFIPILYPIYEELLNQLKTFTYGLYKPIAAPAWDAFPHVKRDNPYWSNNNNENPQIDPLDAIEIENLELFFNIVNC